MEITSQSLKLVGDFSHANGQIPLNQATKNAIFTAVRDSITATEAIAASELEAEVVQLFPYPSTEDSNVCLVMSVLSTSTDDPGSLSTEYHASGAQYTEYDSPCSQSAEYNAPGTQYTKDNAPASQSTEYHAPGTQYTEDNASTSQATENHVPGIQYTEDNSPGSQST